jgi:putative hydrolase of the HAD superfamily
MQIGPMPSRQSDNPNIKAVILDYGLVLSCCPRPDEFGRMAQVFRVSFESFYRLWETSRDLYDRGSLSAEEYWRNLATKTGTSIDAGQITFLRKVEVEIWSHVDGDMLDWVRQLHRAGIKTGLLSNMPLDLAAHVRTNCRWMENFDFQTLSAEVGLIKPDPAIYEYTLRGLEVAAAESLFVDDREINILAARKLGIHAIQFTSIAQLKKELEKLSFSILPTIAGPSEVNSTEPSQEAVKFQL